MEKFKKSKTGQLSRKITDEQVNATYQDLNKLVDEVNSLQNQINNIGGLPYSYYVGRISQSGTSAPTVSFEDSSGLGETFTYARLAPGTYRIRFDDSYFTVPSKVLFFTKGMSARGLVGPNWEYATAEFEVNDVNEIVLYTVKYGNPEDDNLLNNFNFEIRVYP